MLSVLTFGEIFEGFNELYHVFLLMDLMRVLRFDSSFEEVGVDLFPVGNIQVLFDVGKFRSNGAYSLVFIVLEPVLVGCYTFLRHWNQFFLNNKPFVFLYGKCGSFL